MRRVIAVALMLVACAALAAPALADHAIAMHGKPALASTFTHFPYANPDAPKGGRMVFGLQGTFDNINPLIVKGIAVQQIRGYVIESLLTRGHDEPFTLYGLLAQSVETDEAHSAVTFRLNPAAQFSDGHPVTADDVLFSWRLLRDKGRPNHRLYYAKVVRAEAIDRLTVRFTFSDTVDRELPLILGLMPILPRHAVDEATFEETTFAPPVGSGPYTVSQVQPGASVTFSRNPAYWGRDLPVNRGLWNFDEIRIDFYREANSHFEAFKRGLYDFRVEHEPLRWQTGYDFAAVRDGHIVRETFATGLPRPSEFLVFNTRRPVFADIRVREALALLFDFEWINRNYFFDLYSRSGSFFAGSELSAYGLAADAAERALLAPFAADVRPDILNGTWALPVSDSSGRDRAALKAALSLLREAGYELNSGVLRRANDGASFAFEILVTTRDQERLALAYARDLKRAGIVANVRVVDAVQFDQRRLAFDYDMIENRWDQSLSPGNEQSFYWGAAAAGQQGTRNYMGARNAAIDGMIATLLAARERPAFVSAVRALDRVLMSGFYVIPLYNVPGQWIARRSTIEWPATTSLSGYLPETWWRRPEKDRARP